MVGKEVEQLIQLLAKLPGLGPRSARRVALHLINHKLDLMEPLGVAIDVAAKAVKVCSACGNIDTIDPCHICNDMRRDKTTICVVEQVADLWAIERAGVFQGQYHVLGGCLSALDGIGPEDLQIPKLVTRIQQARIQELVLATNATVEGQTTAHYISDCLKDTNVRISRLARGLPVGGELDYLDDGTLNAAFRARTVV